MDDPVIAPSDTARHFQASLPEVPPLRALALLFLRLGLTAFGGPAAHIAMMEDEVVRRRRWLSREQFLDLLGAANLLPGPSSTELAIYIGWLLGGWSGLVLAGTCFILPAALLVAGLAWAYLNWGTLPQVAGILYGVKPAVIAIIVQALGRLGRASVKTPGLAVVGVLAMVLSFLGVNLLVVLFGSGLAVAAGQWFRRREQKTDPGAGLSAMPLAASAVAGPAVIAPFGLWPLFLVFLKIGFVLFGSGYVLLAFLRADLVERRGWLTETQLLDAVAVGQVTPGPVSTTATFIGYLLAGPWGAVVATIGIFLPAFLLVAVSGPLMPRLRRSPAAGAFLDGVNVASLALMAVVSWQLGRAALVDGITAALAGISALLLLRYRVNSVWLVLGGAGVGLVVSLVREG